MGKHSRFGPIDPQMVSAQWTAPAHAILLQFDQAKEECKDPSLLGAWIPILQQYGLARRIQGVTATPRRDGNASLS